MKTQFPVQAMLAFALSLSNVGSATAGQDKLAAAMRETRDEVIQTRDQLQTTVNSIDALVKQKKGDLRPVYDDFAAQVTKTQAAAATTKSRVQKMQTEAQAHFSGWQAELESVNNPKLKDKGTKRLENVQKSYNQVLNQLEAASIKFDPYLSDLADMKKMLANDLTPTGVKAIRGTVGDAKFHLQNVRRPLYDAIKELDKMQKALTTSAGE
jgi:hypothetical protein